MIFKKIFFFLKAIIFLGGLIFLIYLILAFTSVPYNSYYKAGKKFHNDTIRPDYIVMMGAGGMPEEGNLMRSYYSSLLLKKFPSSFLIIALPGDTTDTTNSLYLLVKEFEIRGIEKRRILLEKKGVNTRSQALNVFKMLKDSAKKQIIIVTSPEHIKRSVLCFKKAGLKDVYGLPSFSSELESNLKFKNKDLGGNIFVPSIGQSIAIRYRFWIYIKYEMFLTREFCASLYYKIKGWI